MGDLRDLYSFQGSAGQEATYGFAVAGDPSPLGLTLLDSAGNPLGPTLTSGQRASVSLPSAGTYYLSAARSALGAEELGYLVSVTVGPPDPGNGCRPTC